MAEEVLRNTKLYSPMHVPQPPKPNNRERYILWNKRNISTKAIEQTEAVLFLNSNGYKLNKHYEAYQAIN